MYVFETHNSVYIVKDGRITRQSDLSIDRAPDLNITAAPFKCNARPTVGRPFRFTLVGHGPITTSTVVETIGC